mgnify:FL=1|tara:strand:+ start:278 stop:910 length:633 start_codon:yes stop_codon:yes gene_type:complete
MNYKQINENWQQFLTEQNEQTLGAFVLAMRKSNRSKKIFNGFAKLARVAAKMGVGKAIGGLAAGGATLGVGAAAGAAGGAVVDKAVEMITDKIIERSEDFVKAIIQQYKETPDSERDNDPLAQYFDLDDELQNAMRGGADKDGPLLQKFEDEYIKTLQKELEGAYDVGDEETRNLPLSNWLQGKLKANQALKDFVKSYADTQGVLVGKEG